MATGCYPFLNPTRTGQSRIIMESFVPYSLSGVRDGGFDNWKKVSDCFVESGCSFQITLLTCYLKNKINDK